MDGILRRYEAITRVSLGMLLVGVLVLILDGTAAIGATGKGGILRIGMTAADIAYTAGQPDQGFEGFRFVGYPLYDALVGWDLGPVAGGALAGNRLRPRRVMGSG